MFGLPTCFFRHTVSLFADVFTCALYEPADFETRMRWTRLAMCAIAYFRAPCDGFWRCGVQSARFAVSGEGVAENAMLVHSGGAGAARRTYYLDVASHIADGVGTALLREMGETSGRARGSQCPLKRKRRAKLMLPFGGAWHRATGVLQRTI